MKDKKNQKIKLSLCLIVLFILSLGGIEFTGKEKKNTENSSSNSENKKVVIGFPGISNNTLEAGGIAKHEKYLEEELKKEGYEVEFVFFQQAGPALNEALAARKIDVAMYGDLPITVLRSNGADVKVFAVDNSQLQFGTLVQKESKAKTISDLQNTKVIFGKGTVQQKYFEEIVKSYKLDPSNFQMVNAVGADANSVFSAKQAESIFTFYYTVLFMESKGMGKVIDSTINKPDIASQSLVVGRNEFLEKNERAAVGIIRALHRAKEFAGKNPEKVFKIFSKNGIPQEIYKKAYSGDKTFKNFNPEITQDTGEKLEKVIEFLYNNKLIKNRIKSEDLLTDKYYKLYLNSK